MDITHVVVVALLVVMVVSYVVGAYMIVRLLRKDQAIDAATFLALRDLRERFERTK